MNGNCRSILRHLLTYNIHVKYVHVKVVDCSSWGNDKKNLFWNSPMHRPVRKH